MYEVKLCIKLKPFTLSSANTKTSRINIQFLICKMPRNKLYHAV